MLAWHCCCGKLFLTVSNAISTIIFPPILYLLYIFSWLLSLFPTHHESRRPKLQEKMDILSDRKPRPRSTQLLLSLWQIIGIFTCLITLVGISDIFQVSGMHNRVTTKTHQTLMLFCAIFFSEWQTQTLLAQKNLQMIQLLVSPTWCIWLSPS